MGRITALMAGIYHVWGFNMLFHARPNQGHGGRQACWADGNDAFLCAEYEWDGEYYVQDFGPHHIRKRGQHMTVRQMLDKGPNGVMESDFAQHADANSMKRLDDTRDDPFMTTRPPDTGGGLSAFLDDSR